jgi:hypothetical protein
MGSSVKRYSRPAAGRALEASDIRTPETLNRVVGVLFQHLGRCSSPLDECCAVVADRLRAVRQDLIVQGVAQTEALRCIVATLRHHAVSAFLLSSSSSELWNPVHNDVRLAEALALGEEMLQTLQARSSTPLPELAACAAELAAFRLVLSWSDPLELKVAYRAAWRQDVAAHEVLASACRATLLWSACHWYAFMKEVQSWELLPAQRTSESTASCLASDRGGSVALRCLAHRFLPWARTCVLRSLNASFLERHTVPLAAVSLLLCFKPSTGAIVTQLAEARFLQQWGLHFLQPDSGAQVTLADLQTDASTNTSRSTPVAVVWSKAANIDPYSTEMTARLALTARFDAVVACALGISSSTPSTVPLATWPAWLFEGLVDSELLVEHDAITTA